MNGRRKNCYLNRDAKKKYVINPPKSANGKITIL